MEPPSSLHALTAQWVEDRLRAAGILTGPARVRAISLEPIEKGRGLLSEIARVRLDYDGDPGAAAATIIAKLPPERPESRDIGFALRAYERESRFYGEIAKAAPVATAALIDTAVDEAGRGFHLLLEDLAPAPVGDQLDGWTPQQARAAIGEIARFHAKWWESRALAALDWVPRWNAPELVAIVSGAYAQAQPGFEAAYTGAVPDSVVALSRELGARIGELADHLAGPAETLVHGDFRIDNLLFPRGEATRIVDWQILARGLGVFDVAYLLTQSGEVELRRAHEQALLRHYLASLAAAGVDDYDAERCERDYRVAVLYGLVYVVIGAGLVGEGDPRGAELVRRAAIRVSHAVDDLDAGAAI